jgi:hypothetical protein
MIVKVRNPFSLLRRKLTFRFNNLAWINMCELNGREFWELGDMPEEHIALSWIYGAYLSACANEFKRPRYDFNYINRVYRWYYVNDYKVIAEWKQAIQKSKLMGRSIEEWEEVGSEKKK